jgi:hypothetical protein
VSEDRSVITHCILSINNICHQQIFPGGDQLSKFGKILASFKKDPAISALLHVNGYDLSDISVHSLRKGAGSYATCGVVGMTPSTVAMSESDVGDWRKQEIVSSNMRQHKINIWVAYYADCLLTEVNSALFLHTGENRSKKKPFKTS